MSNAQPSINHADLGMKLLTDLQSYFARQPAQHYQTEQLLSYLVGIDPAPWATFDQGKAITARHLARLLQPYGIVSKTIRVSATATPKCYRVADFKNAFAKFVADRSPVVADNVADNVVDKIDVSDNVLDVADHVAANVLDATRHQLHQLGESLARGYEATGHPFSHVRPSDLQQWRDLADLMRKAADSIESFTVSHRPTLTLIQGGVAADVAAVRAADQAAVRADRKRMMAAPVHPPVQAKKSPWPPPNGWVWNYQTACYEPPKPPVQPDPSVILQPLQMAPNLKYRPGHGLVAIDPQETA